MIAPTDLRRKGAAVASARRIVCILYPPDMNRHGIVSGIIIPPYFRLSTALLDCDKNISRWPGPFGSGFLSPQPPGVVRIGPVRGIVYPHTGPTRAGPFLFERPAFDGLDPANAIPHCGNTSIAHHPSNISRTLNRPRRPESSGQH